MSEWKGEEGRKRERTKAEERRGQNRLSFNETCFEGESGGL